LVAAAAGVIAAASRRLGVANKWGWDFCWCKREAGAARVYGEKRAEVDLAVSTDGASMAAARAGAPASLQLGLGNKWPGQLQWCERKGVGACICSEGKRSERLGGDLQWRTAAEQTGGGETQAHKRDSSGSFIAANGALVCKTTTVVVAWV
jgi:hypothetical protein